MTSDTFEQILEICGEIWRLDDTAAVHTRSRQRPNVRVRMAAVNLARKWAGGTHKSISAALGRSTGTVEYYLRVWPKILRNEPLTNHRWTTAEKRIVAAGLATPPREPAA